MCAHMQACFMKLCKETGLVGPLLSPTAADLAFAAVKNRCTRRIAFDQVRRRIGVPFGVHERVS